MFLWHVHVLLVHAIMCTVMHSLCGLATNPYYQPTLSVNTRAPNGRLAMHFCSSEALHESTSKYARKAFTVFVF